VVKRVEVLQIPTLFTTLSLRRNIFGSNSYPQPIDKFNKFITAINKLAGSNIELVEDI